MHSPFNNSDNSVERASRIISGLFVALFVSVDAALAVGWHNGELKERVLVPGQVLAEYSVQQLERWAESQIDEADDDYEAIIADEPEGWEENVDVTVTTTKTYTNSAPAAQPTPRPYTYTPPTAPKLEEVDYNPPAWFVESSAKSHAEFEAKSQQSKTDFEAYAAKSKADFDAAKAAAGL